MQNSMLHHGTNPQIHTRKHRLTRNPHSHKIRCSPVMSRGRVMPEPNSRGKSSDSIQKLPCHQQLTTCSGARSHDTVEHSGTQQDPASQRNPSGVEISIKRQLFLARKYGGFGTTAQHLRTRLCNSFFVAGWMTSATPTECYMPWLQPMTSKHARQTLPFAG